MIEIVTKTNSFVLNGIQYAKNDLTVQPTTTGVKIGHFAAKLDEVTIDGSSFASLDELHSALDTALFKKGGGAPGEGVQSVNGVSPDESGNINVSGVNINANFNGSNITIQTAL